jgi:genome maintenance exonuclease 1
MSIITIKAERKQTQNGRYYVAPNGIHYPSVTTVLSKTADESKAFILEKWKNRRIEALGKEAFEAAVEERFRSGTQVHEWIESYFKSGYTPDIFEDPLSIGWWNSIVQVLPEIEPLAMESFTYHPTVKYSGTFDLLARYKGELHLVDWKTKEMPIEGVDSPYKIEKFKKDQPLELSDLYDNPFQIAAYLGAANQDENYKHLGVIKRGLVVVCFEDGRPPQLFEFGPVQIKQFWFQWNRRVKRFYSNPKSTVRESMRKLATLQESW